MSIEHEFSDQSVIMDSFLTMCAYIKQSKGNSIEDQQTSMRLIRSLIFIFFGLDKDLIK